MSVLYPTISHLSLDSFGHSETLYKPHDELLFYVLCDAINLTAPAESLKISKIFEKSIRQYLQLYRNEMSEKLLKKSIEHAQNYFHKHYISFENQLKVSVVIIVQLPSSPDGNKKILISGVGDLKVYHLSASLELLYYDSEVPQLPENLSLKNRFNYITNAIGAPDLSPKVTMAELATDSSLLVATYGCYQQTNKEKLFSLFSDFKNKKNQLNKLIQKVKGKGHLKSFSLITFNALLAPQGEDLEEPISNEPKKEKGKKERYLPIWAVKIALVAIVCFICLEFFNSYLNISKANLCFNSTKTQPKGKVTEANLSLKSLKKPLEFPFLKERAYIVDLKEKHEKQGEVIEKLQEIISEQDKSLRILQVKSYYQPDTISAKSFRPTYHEFEGESEKENYTLGE